MASLKYIIADCKNPTKEEIKRVSGEHMQSITHSSIKHEDKFKGRLNSLKVEGVTLVCHRCCGSSYTFQHLVDRYVRKSKSVEEKDSSVDKKRTRQSICQTFNLKKYCLFFGEECNDIINTKNPGRWRPYLVRAFVTVNNIPFKDFILKICLLRNSIWFKEVKFRVEPGVSDLHAADARYHKFSSFELP